MDIQNDVPKYRKKKSQESKSSKRSDHKHNYVKSIRLNFYSNVVEGILTSSMIRILNSQPLQKSHIKESSDTI